MIYDAIEPIGEGRLDFLFAYLIAAIFNLFLRREGQTPAIPKDFLIDFWANERRGGEPAEQSPEEQRAMIEMMKLIFEPAGSR